MRRRRVLASLMAAIALLAAVLWWAERGWRSAQQTAATPALAPAEHREVFSISGPEQVTRGGLRAPPPQPNVSSPPARPLTASRPLSPAPRTAARPTVDERPLWELLQQRRHEDLRDAIAAERQAHPEWRPPPQLTELMNAADADADYQRHITALTQAKTAGDETRALQEAAVLAPLVEARRDAAAARMLGWTHYDAGQDQAAAEWFSKSREWSPSEEAAYGHALASTRRGDHDAAMAAAREYSDSPRIAAVAREGALARARERHEAGDYAGSEQALAEAARHGEWDRGAQLLHAWNLAKQGREDEAGKVFEELYRAQPDEASADGLLFSYGEARNEAALARLSAELDGPLAEKYRLQQARQAYARKQFLAAGRLAPEAYPLLENIGRPDLTGGIIWRQRSGISGLSRLSLTKAPWLEARFGTGGALWRIQAEDVYLESGSLAGDAAVGSALSTSVPDRARAPGNIDAGAELRVSVEYQGAFAPYASIATTPLDGPVNHRWLGQLGATWHGARASASLEWAERPVRDSALSYVGMVDPYTGVEWGRVVAQGFSGRVYSAVAPGWDMYAQAQWAKLRGSRVMTNERQGVDVSVSRVVHRPGYDRIAIGPYVGYERYAKNLSHFTLGHGGYFSPQLLLRTGMALEVLTEEGQPGVMRARLALGYQMHRQDEMSYLPFTPDPPSGAISPRVYPASDEMGVTLNGEWYGVWRLAPRWQLGGGAVYRHSPAFDEMFAGAFIRYSLDKRPALFSSDLPPTLFGGVE